MENRRASRMLLAFVFVTLGIVLELLWLSAPVAHGSTPIIVNTTLDETDPTDGKCSLREAIVAANMNIASGGTPGECAAGSPGMDTINITPPARFLCWAICQISLIP